MDRKLSAEEFHTIYSLLKSDQRPLDEIMADFSSKIPHAHHFTLCSYLVMLLEDMKILNTTQHLVAFAIIYQAYSSHKPASNPFLSFILNVAYNGRAYKFEKAFVLQLLSIDGSNGDTGVFPQLYQLRQQFSDKVHAEPYHCSFKDSSVKNVVSDPDLPPGCDAESLEYGSGLICNLEQSLNLDLEIKMRQ